MLGRPYDGWGCGKCQAQAGAGVELKCLMVDFLRNSIIITVAF